MARGSTLNVSLTSKLDRYVQEKVDEGGYESASEVIRESLRVSRAIEADQFRFWSEVRDKVAVARKDIAEGNFVDGPAFMDNLIAEMEGKPQRQKTKKRK